MGMSDPPVIVRLAGLPARALEPLTSGPCLALLEAREVLDEELEEARRSMVKVIEGVLPIFDVTARRFLLAIKRNCFKNREIQGCRKQAGWETLVRASAGLAERIVLLEEQLCENGHAFAALYEQERVRERRHVLEVSQDRRFLRGIALGRRGLVEKFRAHAPSLAASVDPKKSAKWEESLLRFLTRAAAKLSANSTLTAYALGTVQASPAFGGFRFLHRPEDEISLVRINRPEIEQFQSLLMRNPAVREHALVAWNDTVEELEPGKYRLLRDGYWHFELDSESFHFVPPARVRVSLSNALLCTVRNTLHEGPLRYGGLLSLLAPGRGDSTSKSAVSWIQEALEQLVDLGFLILTPPWPTYEPWLEWRIGEFLRALPDDFSLQATTEALDDLLKLERLFASAPRPETTVAEMEDVFSRLLDTVAPPTGNGRRISMRAHFFEDVLIGSAASPRTDQELFQIADSVVESILRSAGLVSRFAGLFNHRHDILHTLAAWWRETEPGRREMAFVEVAKEFAPLWRQYLHFHETANESALNTFNPLHAVALEALLENRERLLSQSSLLLSQQPMRDVLPMHEFEECLELLPRRYAPLVGSCVFVQPGDPEGSFWVLNSLHEGTGRYLSRITPLLEVSLQNRLGSHLIERSVIDLGSEEADLLEVMHPWGYLMEAHSPQAVKVLDVRGLYLDLPRARRVDLSDLSIQADLESESFRLIDRSGRRVLPVHLSSRSDATLSPLLRLLLVFGPGETRGVFPFAHSAGDEYCRAFSRLACGGLVLRRRRWVVAVGGLREEIEGVADRKAYMKVHRWRRRWGLPSACFYSERTYNGAIKPQYVDFSSPSLCGLFVTSVRRMTTGRLVLEEALPSPSGFPCDGGMNRRGFELLIDSLVIRAPGGTPLPGEWVSTERATLSERMIRNG